MLRDSRPARWLRRAGERPTRLLFALGLALQLAWLFRLSLEPGQIDVDTAAHVEQLRAAPDFRTMVQQRDYWQVAKPLLGPTVYALQVATPDPLNAYRLLTFGGAALGAEALRRTALLLGAQPAAAALAALLPVTSFGGAFLAATLDDNVAASGLQWLTFLALAVYLRSDGRVWSGVAGALGLGLLTGICVAFHRKTLPVLALLPLAPLLSASFRRPRALVGLPLAFGTAVATVALSSALFLPPGFSRETLVRMIWSPHHQNAAWWYFAGETSLTGELARLWSGWCSSLVGFPALLDQRFGATSVHLLDLLVPAAVVLAAVSAWLVRARPLCRLLAAAVAVEALHSFFYEPASVERWDTVVAGAGVLVAVAATVRDDARIAAAGLWLALLAVAHFSLGLWLDAARNAAS